MLSDEEIKNGYIYVLGRPPESEAVLKQYRGMASVENFRKALLGSDEFKTKFASVTPAKTNRFRRAKNFNSTSTCSPAML